MMKRILTLSLAVLIQINFAVAADKSAKAGTKDSSIAPAERALTDGRVLEVISAGERGPESAAPIMEDDTLRCPLQEGETTFVIKVSSGSLLDRLTFVNENATAAGQLKISVSNDPLPAASPKWVDVNGNVAFKQKRRFNLSMVGVEARYVKLSFHVEKAERIAALGL